MVPSFREVEDYNNVIANFIKGIKIYMERNETFYSEIFSLIYFFRKVGLDYGEIQKWGSRFEFL